MLSDVDRILSNFADDYAKLAEWFVLTGIQQRILGKGKSGTHNSSTARLNYSVEVNWYFNWTRENICWRTFLFGVHYSCIKVIILPQYLRNVIISTPAKEPVITTLICYQDTYSLRVGVFLYIYHQTVSIRNSSPKFQYWRIQIKTRRI